MRKFPWKWIATVCAVLVILVTGRCAVTVGRVMYYKSGDWLANILNDPWFYVGMAAAAICAVSFFVLAISPKRKEMEKADA